MAIETLRDLLRHELGELYHAEQQMVVMLDEIELEADSMLLRDRIRVHRQDTMRQLDTLERCFELVGAAPPHVECAMVQGIRADRHAFLAAGPTPAVVEAYDLHAVARLAHCAAASYRLLAGIAHGINHDDVRRLLEKCLAAELALAAWIVDHADALIAGGATRPARRVPARAAAAVG